MLRWPVPAILAALAAFGAVTPATDAEVRIQLASERLIEITGEGWRLRYGTSDPEFASRQLLVLNGERAYFSHGGWLRLIDTKKGLITGRWHFPGKIVRLTAAGNQLQVTVEHGDQPLPKTLTFDAEAPNVPYWPTGGLALDSLPICEPQRSVPTRAYRCTLNPNKTPAERAKEEIPVLEEMVRRDPLSPWLRVGLGKLLRDVGDPRAAALFQQVIQVPTTDFTELLPISAFLERLGEREKAATAFERGYRDFWEHGNDPRLFIILIGRLILYHPFGSDPQKIPLEQRRPLIENIYRLTPNGEAAEMAWRIYADYLEKNGQGEEARMWRRRAEETSATSIYVFPTVSLDRTILVVCGSVAAAVLYLLILFARYRPQKRLALAAKTPGSSPLNLTYWSRRERIVFFTIALIGWLSLGVSRGYLAGLMRMAGTPISLGMGTFAGPVTTWFFETRLPATPERDLLLAMAYQHSGEKEKAERLYRGLPDFAESWNNLGVLLKEAGKEQDARQAFERALQLDPALAEATLNLGRPPQGLWAELHHKYRPGHPMIAPPKRERMMRAFLAGSLGKLYLRGLGGPFVGDPLEKVLGPLRAELSVLVMARILPLLPVIVMALAIAMLLVVPSREVTQPPGKSHWVLEVLFPGSAPAWSFLGGLLLLTWSYFLVQDLLLFWKGTPYITTFISVPNVVRSYGVPGDFNVLLFKRVGGLINPSWVWVYLAPALLFAVNLALVLREKRREAGN